MMLNMTPKVKLRTQTPRFSRQTGQMKSNPSTNQDLKKRSLEVFTDMGSKSRLKSRKSVSFQSFRAETRLLKDNRGLERPLLLLLEFFNKLTQHLTRPRRSFLFTQESLPIKFSKSWKALASTPASKSMHVLEEPKSKTTSKNSRAAFMLQLEHPEELRTT